MMTGPVGSLVAAVMQESFGFSVTNRFFQLLDDESDPFDVLREAEHRQQQRKKRDEVVAAARRDVPGRRAGGGRRETQKERKQPESSPAAPPQPGPKRVPRQGEQQGFSNRGTEGKREKTERRPSFREYRPYGAQRQVEFSVERPVEILDYERSIRGRGGGRGRMRGRGRGGGLNGSFDGFDQRRKREAERQSGNDKIGVKADDKKGGGGAWNCRTIKDDMSGMEQTASVEETVETPEQPGTSEGEPLSPSNTVSDCNERGTTGSAYQSFNLEFLVNKAGIFKITGHKGMSEGRAAEGEPMEEVVQEMTLDEWKNLQQRSRPKPEFNIRKPESTVPSKAVVIHKSKYSDDLQKEEFEDDSHVFRKPVNDITSQLDINFGSLPYPGRGSRGARGGRGRGRGRRPEGPQPEVVVQLVAPNPDDPEDFPALA